MSLGNHRNGVWDSSEILHWAQIYLQDKVGSSFLTRHVSNIGMYPILVGKYFSYMGVRKSWSGSKSLSWGKP